MSAIEYTAFGSVLLVMMIRDIVMTALFRRERRIHEQYIAFLESSVETWKAEALDLACRLDVEQRDSGRGMGMRS